MVGTAKYKRRVTPEHKFMFSPGVSRPFARTDATGGTTAALGNDEASLLTRKVYRGFGDLPIGLLRPLALTGTPGNQIADNRLRSGQRQPAAQQWHSECVKRR